LRITGGNCPADKPGDHEPPSAALRRLSPCQGSSIARPGAAFANAGRTFVIYDSFEEKSNGERCAARAPRGNDEIRMTNDE